MNKTDNLEERVCALEDKIEQYSVVIARLIRAFGYTTSATEKILKNIDEIMGGADDEYMDRAVKRIREEVLAEMATEKSKLS